MTDFFRANFLYAKKTNQVKMRDGKEKAGQKSLLWGFSLSAVRVFVPSNIKINGNIIIP